MKSRTKARSVALQALYEINLTGHNPGSVIQERLEESPLDAELSEFVSDIVMGVSNLSTRLDNFISQHAPEWPLISAFIIR